MSKAIIGLDVGGANLKAAFHHADKQSCATRPFALWRNPAGLADALAELIRERPVDQIALTMTGELCDCFASKREGVLHILGAVERVAKGKQLRVWGTDGNFHDLDQVRAAPLTAAASNWLALATWAGRFVPRGPALLLDVGSTTTDVIPLLDGKPRPLGRTDRERLFRSELVYTGVRRTPVCAVVNDAVATEVFATTLDAYLILGEIEDDPSDSNTADGRPATREHAHARLARMICADLETCSEGDRESLARWVQRVQRGQIAGAMEQVAKHLPGEAATAVIIAGSGEFLARQAAGTAQRVAGKPVLSLAEQFGETISTAACAHAVAVLASEREG